MTTAQFAILKKAVDLARLGIEYVERDQKIMLGLTRPQWVVFEGPGIARGSFDNGILAITSRRGGGADGADVVRLDARAFSALMRFWNGPDGICNKVGDGRLESSLWHDLTWKFAAQIAAEWGFTEMEVLLWANALFAAAWKGYAKFYPDARFVNLKVRVAYGATQFAAPWYHRLKRILGFTVFAVCFVGCHGCALFDAPPADVVMVDSSGPFRDAVESVEPWISTNVVEGVR